MRETAEALVVRRGTFPLTVIGVIESILITTERAPKQGSAGAPDAWLVVDAAYTLGLTGITIGQELIVVTWRTAPAATCFRFIRRVIRRTPSWVYSRRVLPTDRTRSGYIACECGRSKRTG